MPWKDSAKMKSLGGGLGMGFFFCDTLACHCIHVCHHEIGDCTLFCLSKYLPCLETTVHHFGSKVDDELIFSMNCRNQRAPAV